jgi:hypothetical protein
VRIGTINAKCYFEINHVMIFNLEIIKWVKCFSKSRMIDRAVSIWISMENYFYKMNDHSSIDSLYIWSIDRKTKRSRLRNLFSINITRIIFFFFFFFQHRWKINIHGLEKDELSIYFIVNNHIPKHLIPEYQQNG